MRRQRGLSGAIIGQRVSCCYKRRVVWRLTTRVFDLVTVGGVGIVASRAGMFAERAEVSCVGLAVSNNQEKHLGNSQGEGLVGLGNG